MKKKEGVPTGRPQAVREARDYVLETMVVYESKMISGGVYTTEICVPHKDYALIVRGYSYRSGNDENVESEGRNRSRGRAIQIATRYIANEQTDVSGVVTSDAPVKTKYHNYVLGSFIRLETLS